MCTFQTKLNSFSEYRIMLDPSVINPAKWILYISDKRARPCERAGRDEAVSGNIQFWTRMALFKGRRFCPIWEHKLKIAWFDLWFGLKLKLKCYGVCCIMLFSVRVGILSFNQDRKILSHRRMFMMFLWWLAVRQWWSCGVIKIFVDVVIVNLYWR